VARIAASAVAGSSSPVTPFRSFRCPSGSARSFSSTYSAASAASFRCTVTTGAFRLVERPVTDTPLMPPKMILNAFSSVVRSGHRRRARRIRVRIGVVLVVLGSRVHVKPVRSASIVSSRSGDARRTQSGSSLFGRCVYASESIQRRTSDRKL
jgi:hypothetical protein